MKELKSYSFFDIIGTKDLIKNSKIESVLNAFYNKTKNFINNNLWTKYGIKESQPCVNKNCYCSFYIMGDIISDSILIEMDSKFSIDLLAEVSFAFQKYLLESEPKIRSYFIINSDLEYIPDIDIPDFKVTPGNKTREKFRCLVLPGKAWLNIYIADNIIKDMKDWHKKYNAYFLNPKKDDYSSFLISNTTNVKYDRNDEIIIAAIKEKQ